MKKVYRIHVMTSAPGAAEPDAAAAVADILGAGLHASRSDGPPTREARAEHRRCLIRGPRRSAGGRQCARALDLDRTCLGGDSLWEGLVADSAGLYAARGTEARVRPDVCNCACDCAAASCPYLTRGMVAAARAEV